MMHLLRKYDVAPLRSAMMRCVPQNVAKPRIIRAANIIRRSRHHLPKANIIQKTHLCLGRQKCVFCWLGMKDLNPHKQSQSLSCCHYTNPQYFLFALCDGYYYSKGALSCQVYFCKFLSFYSTFFRMYQKCREQKPRNG